MTTKNDRGYRGISMDKETQEIVYEGANQTQLSRLFRVDKHRVKQRLLHVTPDGKRMGTPIWKVSTAAPYLVKPLFDVENYIRNMNHAELPPHLTKEFWAGQRAKLSLEEDQGERWLTADVMEAIAEILRLVRMSVMLIPDQLEKVTTLTPKQKGLVSEQTDALLDELRKTIIRRFSENPSGQTTPEVVEQKITEVENETLEIEEADGEETEDYSDL